MFSICTVGFFTLGYEAIVNGSLGGIILFSVLLPILSIWYVCLFISIIREKFISIFFNNMDRILKLESKDGTNIDIPYSDIKSIKVRVYDYIRFIKATCVYIYTTNSVYKVTYPTKLEIQKILSETNINTEYKNTHFFFMP